MQLRLGGRRQEGGKAAQTLRDLFTRNGKLLSLSRLEIKVSTSIEVLFPSPPLLHVLPTLTPLLSLGQMFA